MDDLRKKRVEAAAMKIRVAGNYRWVGIYDVTPDEVRIIAYSGPSAPEYPNFSRERGLTGRMLRTGTTVCVNDVTKDSDYLTAFGSTRSEIIVPIRVHGEIAGTLDVESEQVNAFGDAEREDLERIADSLAALFIPQSDPTAQ